MTEEQFVEWYCQGWRDMEVFGERSPPEDANKNERAAWRQGAEDAHLYADDDYVQEEIVILARATWRRGQ